MPRLDLKLDDTPTIPRRLQIYISLKFKFIFVRQAKSSSTAVLNYITKHLCAGEECTAEELINAVHIEDETWKNFFVYAPLMRPAPCVRMLSTALPLSGFSHAPAHIDQCSIMK